ncbi:thrombospondin-related adhesive protein [Babesia caballi]|uniref:Thrombospondin-related adhesive protein n=1 Tax=Babesia caballi TaxID=5871 RepID=A0AAV4LWU3_BABCB|nr:thrombospondin-related adhesive protein [Babesia caballi]
MVRVQIFSTAATLAILCASCVSAYRYGEPAQQPSSRRSTPNGDDVDIHGQQESYQPVDVAYNGPRFNTNDYGYRRRGAAGNAESGAGHNAPTSYGNRDVNRSLSQAKVTGHVTRTVSGKDYIIALENTSHFGGATWHMTLRAFVKSIAQELSTVGGGTNTLSLVTFGASSRRWLGRRVINRESVRQVVTKIDQMFDAQSASGDVKAGEALRFMRNSMYPNSDKYLLNDRTTELQLENAAGKDTVVILISSGMVDDKELALQEAFDARRNGVTLFVVEMSHKAEKFWTRLLGCRNYNDCPHYISSSRRTLPSRVGYLMRLIRSHHRKDALCLEDWSEYTTCSKPCDGGTKTSTLQGYQTLLTHSVYSAEGRGRTCDDQLRNIKVRQMLCNMQPCQPTTRSEARASSHEETDDNSALPHATSMLQEVGEESSDESLEQPEMSQYRDSPLEGDEELGEEQILKKVDEFYTPEVKPEKDGELKNVSTSEVDQLRERQQEGTQTAQTHIPRLYDGDKGLKLMLEHAEDVNHSIGMCDGAGKDYVIALERTTHFKKQQWEEDILSFLKLFVYGLSATSGTNTLTVVTYDISAHTVLPRTLINKENARKVGLEIDRIIAEKPVFKDAKPGIALTFMRQNVYPNGSEYLLGDSKTKLRLDTAAGKNTVVVMISSGTVLDEALALKEAFDARRNGATFFLVEVGHKMEKFWARLLGCRYYYSCPNFISSYGYSIMNTMYSLMRRVCSPSGKDAVCEEVWSEFSPCSKTCGVGIKTSVLQGYKTLLTGEEGAGETAGHSCASQLANIRKRQVLCNVHSCPPGTTGEIMGQDYQLPKAVDNIVDLSVDPTSDEEGPLSHGQSETSVAEDGQDVTHDDVVYYEAGTGEDEHGDQPVTDMEDEMPDDLEGSETTDVPVYPKGDWVRRDFATESQPEQDISDTTDMDEEYTGESGDDFDSPDGMEQKHTLDMPEEDELSTSADELVTDETFDTPMDTIITERIDVSIDSYGSDEDGEDSMPTIFPYESNSYNYGTLEGDVVPSSDQTNSFPGVNHTVLPPFNYEGERDVSQYGDGDWSSNDGAAEDIPHGHARSNSLETENDHGHHDLEHREASQEHHEAPVRHHRHREEQRWSRFGNRRLVIGAAVAALLAVVGGCMYTSKSKKRTIEPAVPEDREFLGGISGGKDEATESYQVAAANDNIWA